MKRLIFLAGFPAVGKSTISKGISKKTGAKIVEIDDFKKLVVDPNLVASEIDPPELRWKYYQKTMEFVFTLFEQGVSTVTVDEVFHLQLLRQQLEDLCLKHGVQVLWVEVRCPYETVERRLHATKREGHLLSTEQALNMYLLFENIFEKFPADIQNHIVVNNDHDNDTEVLVENILEKEFV